MSSKKEFWSCIQSVACPKCGKEYQHRRFMIYHMHRVHGLSFKKARDLVDDLGIYVPKHDR